MHLQRPTTQDKGIWWAGLRLECAGALLGRRRAPLVELLRYVSCMDVSASEPKNTLVGTHTRRGCSLCSIAVGPRLTGRCPESRWDGHEPLA